MTEATDGSGVLSWRRLMLEELELLRPWVSELPAIASQAVEVADRYWTRGIGEPNDLVTARVACWKYLDAAMGSSTRVVGREAHLTRAVMCLLQANPGHRGVDDEAWDSAWAFADFLNGV